jgi:beta-glucosidase-like glycosyl hydrolase/CubicO group peptidase (beta-lactamase class C family)
MRNLKPTLLVIFSILLLSTFLIAGYSLEKPSAVEDRTTLSADSLLAAMTLEEKIGQLFSVRSYGYFENEHDLSIKRLERLIHEYHIGGVTFFQGDVYGQAHMHNHLQTLAGIPLWISQDMEFGAAMRVRGTTRITPAMGVAATGNPENAYLAGRITAAEAGALGVNQVYAPVLDVNNNPENPVINTRSYSSDPNEVSLYASEFIRGVSDQNLLATGKHFPGHGDTDTDSHLALPVINHDYARLDSVELVPFRDNIQNGLESIMSAHIAFPEISDNIDLPGTLDPSILNRILVDTLSFSGLVVTDGLEMNGISNYYAPGEAVVRALQSGVDVLLLSPDEMTAIDGLKKAVETGRITEERIDRSVRKILALKFDYGLFENPFVDIQSLRRKINTPEYQEIANRIARESITVLKDQADLLPIRENQLERILVLSVDDGDGHSSGSVLAGTFRNYHNRVTYRELNDRTTEEEIEEIKRLVAMHDLVVAGSFIRVRSYQSSQIPRKQLSVLRYIQQSSTPSMLIAFGNPYVVSDIPSFDSHILAWATDANQVRQTIPSLFGGAPISGTFPGEIPGLYERGNGLEYEHSAIRFDSPEAVGMSTDSLMKLDLVMQQAVNDSVFPGGVVGVMRSGVLVWQQGYGYHDYTKTDAVSSGTVYDLASVTKVMATTTSIMKLAGDGIIDVDDPVSKYISEFNTGEKKNITIRHLLLHTSGLPAFRIYVDKLKSRDEIVDAVRNEPLINTPGEEYVYSDLGFILLAEIVHEVTGNHIDEFATQQIFEKLDMYDTQFNPYKFANRFGGRIPPTEIDTIYNRGTVLEVAHDERAYFMDGVAGHAGLFSSVQDIAKYSLMLLNRGDYAGENVIEAEVVEQFTSHQSPVNHRGLGFDRKSEGFSSAGELTGPQTFGHLGFTGTSLWIDPDENIAIILLTNRTYPSRSYGSQISRIRAKVADTVMNSIVD